MNLTHDMLHIDQIFKCEYSSNSNFIVSFPYQEMYVAVFTTPLEWDNSDFSRLCHSHAILASCACHTNGKMSSKSLNGMQTD